MGASTNDVTVRGGGGGLSVGDSSNKKFFFAWNFCDRGGGGPKITKKP